uniref:von Willebrand factor A domain-containing protein 1 n=1 Tax=Esox lucius TaxID=8010 RepID=A0A3P8YB65_ESOLU
MKWFGLSCFLLGVLLLPSTRNVLGLPDTALNCCEGDILLLLDSSGSVSSYEFSRLLRFLSELLLPFSLGQGQVRVGLLQVGTEPHLEFGLDTHSTQHGLQEALRRTKQLQGDTNTDAALRLAKGLLTGAGSQSEHPKVLLWLTDGVRPGRVDEPMEELRKLGVSVLVVSTGHGNYQVLRKVVTPPIENHLYFVDIDDISIITQDLREAIIELIHAERLWVVQVSFQSAVLQWRPVINSNTGFYELHYNAVLPGTRYHRRILPGDSSWVEISDLQPDTSYTASLTPKSNEDYFKTLSVTFTTLSEVLSPAVVTVSDSGPDQVRVSWGPLQPDQVRMYKIEYGALPSGQVSIVTLHGHQNSTVLAGLQPDTLYLVTVSALYSTGKERSVSVKACTQEVLPSLVDLQLTSVGHGAIQAQWRGHEEGLRGYWLRWDGGETQSLFHQGSSYLYLPPGTLSTHLTHLAPRSRVCVSPVYRTARGQGLCCTADTQPGLTPSEWTNTHTHT